MTLPQEKVKLLIVDDDPGFTRILQHLILKGMEKINCEFDTSTAFSEAVSKLQNNTYDICLLDYRINNARGIELLSILRAGGISTPVIFITGMEGQELAVEAMKAGAKDYITKANISPELLAQSIRHGIHLHREEELLRKAQEDLRRASAQNEQFLTSINSILIGLSPSGQINHWNQIAEDTLHLKAGDVLGKKLLDCPMVWESPVIIRGILECQKQKKAVRLDDVRFLHPDGRTGFLGFTINFMKTAGGEEPAGFLLFGADITKRKEAEEQLRIRTDELHLAKAKIEQEKVQYAALLASIGDGMVAVDCEGKITMMNAQAEQMTGYRATASWGKPFYGLIPIQDEKGQTLSPSERPFDKTLATGKKVTMTAYYMRAGKTLFPAAITVSPIVLDGKITGAIEIFRDITREKEIEQMKTEFISTVSHEMRTPLTGIREGVAQVEEGILGPVNAGQKEFLMLSLKELDRLTMIINDLLDIAKTEAGKMELKKAWFDLRKAVDQVVNSYQGLAKSRNLVLRSVLPPEELRIFADSEKLTQVLTNLVSNASKFTGAGGEIVIEARKTPPGFEVSVQDTGRGIHKENLEKIFDRFVQVGRSNGPGIKGTGLGLTISKNLVEMHAGRIWVNSEVGKGSRFTFFIPEEKSRIRPAPAKSERIGEYPGLKQAG